MMSAIEPGRASRHRPSLARSLVVVMGVAGSGKSSVGALLAQRLGCPFLEGDRFHPDANIERMRAGHPLRPEDRWPWIANIVDEVNRIHRRDRDLSKDRPWLAVLACSALSGEIRERLRMDVIDARCRFVHLCGDPALIRQRLTARTGHFFRADLLDSQFRALQPPGPSEALSIGIDQPIDAVVDAILTALSTCNDVVECA